MIYLPIAAAILIGLLLTFGPLWASRAEAEEINER